MMHKKGIESAHVADPSSISADLHGSKDPPAAKYYSNLRSDEVVHGLVKMAGLKDEVVLTSSSEF
jgi:hypothetical protein